ncbi:STAS domain-containing protein [Acrocarpospora pleiomorpha]|nr:STAS domain-containing protein [Acrocarpospora pleiomorpha]
MQYFRVSIEDHPPFTVVKVWGELDIAVEAEFRKHVEETVEQDPARLLFDLSELRLMDSSGVRVILDVYRRLGMGDRVAVCGLSPRIERSFYLLGITGRMGGMTIYSTLENALTAVRS